MKKLLLASLIALASTQAMACGESTISFNNESGNLVASYDIRTGKVQNISKSTRIEKVLAVQSQLESDGTISTRLENMCQAEGCAEIKAMDNAQVIVVYTEDGSMLQKTVKQNMIQSLSIGSSVPVAKCFQF